MVLECTKSPVEKNSEAMETKIFQDDEFIIENHIIKGAEKPNHFTFKTIGEGLLECLNEGSEKIAQIDALTGHKRTFKEVKERSIRLAIWMRKQGIKPGDIVTVCSPNYPDVQIIMIATFFIGAIYNAFPYALDLNFARSCIKLIEPRVIFAYENKMNVLREAAKLENQVYEMIVLGSNSNMTSFDDILNEQSLDEVKNFQVAFDISPQSVCVLLPTSGTTGNPKFASHTCEKVILRLSVEYRELNNTDSITLIQLHPDWTFHFRPTLLHSFLKHTIIFLTDIEPDECFRIVEKYKIDTVILDSYRVLKCCNVNNVCDYDLTSVTCIKSSGNRLYQKTIKRLHQIFPNADHSSTYGLTEAGPISRRSKKCQNPESQGIILPNTTLKIVDVESKLTLGPNEVGEIYIKSPYIMVGYYKNPMETAITCDDEGWFHTGDQGYYDKNGEIIIIGRLKDLIRFRSTDVTSSYVEKVLMSLPDIIEVAVVGIPHDLYAEQPVACIRKIKGSNITDEDVLELTSELAYKDTFKDWIFFVDELPRTINGKVNRRLLIEQLTMEKSTNL